MAKKTYIGVGGKARAVTDIYIGVEGKARRVKKAYVGDANGKAKEVYLACHRYTTAVTAPTCTAQGYTTYTCSLCGHTYKDNYTAAKGHTTVYGGTSGVHQKCSVCNTTLSTSHTYNQDSGVQYSAATCTAKRKNYLKCACGYNPKSTSYLVEVGSVNSSNHTGSSTYGGTSGVHTKYSCCGATISTSHTYNVDSGIQYSAATCTANRKNYLKCACGYNPKSSSYVTEVANTATGHTLKTLAAVAATCTDTGLTEGKQCTVCNTITVAQQTVAKNSSNHTGSVVNGGTSGVHTKYNCCGATVSTTHSYTVDSGVQYSAATCTAKRKNYKKCSCGYNPQSASYLVEVGSVNSSNHTGSVVNGGTSGVHTKYSCCGATVSTSHSYTVDSGVQYTAATCTAARQNYKKCSCGYNPQNSSYVVSTGSVNSSNHTGSEIYGGTSGVHTKYSCCGATISTSHTYNQDSGVQYSAATCIAKRKNYKQCSCGYNPKSSSYLVEVGSVNASNHASTTKVNGGTSSVHSKWQCCGATYQGSSYHSYTVDSGVQYQAATCEANRKNYKRCACGYNPRSSSYVVEIANTATGHDWSEHPCECCVCGEVIHGTDVYYEDVEPTCTTPGQTGGYYCSDCKTVWEEPTVIPETGHDMQNNNDYEAPTCTEDGQYESYYCANGCGHTTGGGSIPATGHGLMVSNGDYEAPTCTEAGQNATYSCSNGCGYTTGGGTIPAKGHASGGTVQENYEDATCTEDGGYDYVTYCVRCDEELSRYSYTISAKGHTDTYVCTRCGEVTGNGECDHEYDNWNDCDCDICGEHRHVLDDYCTCIGCGETFHTIVDGCYCDTCGEEFHDWYEDEAEEAPTCSESGRTAHYSCRNCSSEYGGEYIEPTGDHHFNNWCDCECTECGGWFHEFDGCQCTRCGDYEHDRINCVCRYCGDTEHNYDGCYCIDCGDECHNFQYWDCTCEDCGYENHTYVNGQCNCGLYEPGYDPDACLIASTPILMADGTEKPIAEVKAGDMVKSWDIENNEYIDVEVLGSYQTGEATKWSVYSFDNDKDLTIYNQHNIYCKENNSIKRSTYWKPDQTAIAADGTETSYDSVSEIFTEEAATRHTLLTENNLYFANGILCGHHPRAKYKFFTKGLLTAEPGQLNQYMTTNNIYQAMNGTENEEYRKEAAELIETIRKAKSRVKGRNSKFAKTPAKHRDTMKADILKAGKPVKLREMPEFVEEVDTFKQDIKAINKSIRKARKELNKIKEKYGVSTKTVYECWLEAYKLDMEYLKNKK